MGLFNFGKKKEEVEEIVKKETGCGCCCGGASSNEPSALTSRYIVLGACCKKSEETFENTKTALKEMGIEEEAVNIGDLGEIAAYGVMQTPALVIDNKVVSYGKMLKVDDVKRLIEKASQ